MLLQTGLQKLQTLDGTPTQKQEKFAGIEFGVKNIDNWEKAVQWSISEFGFKNCPIFRIDILDIQINNMISEDGITIGKLRCYTKNASTTLARSKKPTEVHKERCVNVGVVFESGLLKHII